MPLSGPIQSGRVQQQIGKYRHRITIVKPSLKQDSTGGWNVNNTNPVMSCWATIEALSAAEKWAASAFASVVTHKVWIRHPRSRVSKNSFLDGIDSSMQVQFNTRQFQIMSKLIPDERPDAVLLMCAEINDSLNQTATPQESAL